MNEERTIQFGNWNTYDWNGVNNHWCSKCMAWSGKMLRRRVVNRDGEEHLEYKVECSGCERTSGVHWTPRLTVIDWNGKNQPPEPFLPHRNRKPDKKDDIYAASRKKHGTK